MRKARQIPYTSLAVSLLFSITLVIFSIHGLHAVSRTHVFSKLVWPLVRLILAIGAGLVAGEIIEAAGWTRKLAVITGPLFRFGRLGHHCSVAFTTAFVSGVASNAMLQDFYKDRKISKTQLYLTNLANQLPAFFVHLPTTFFMVVPITRWAGILYFLLNFIAAILRMVIVLIYGHVRLPQEPIAQEDAVSSASVQASKDFKTILQKLRQKFPGRLTRMVVYVIPIYVIVFILNSMNVFDMTRDWLARFITTSFIPMESLSLVVLSFTAEFASGFAAAGALMDAGVITTQQTVLALLIGNVIAAPIRTLRHQVPWYVGVFSPRMGLELLLMGQGFRIVSVIIVGFLYYILI
jgi:hypothetical protein